MNEIQTQYLAGEDFVPLKDGEPCSHPGCSQHLSHPCEGCGRYLELHLQKNQPEILSLEEISTQIGKSLLSGVDASYILNLANDLLPGKYSYEGDSIFVKEDD